MKIFFGAFFGSILIVGCGASDEIVASKVEAPTTITSANLAAAQTPVTQKQLDSTTLQQTAARPGS